MTLIHVGMPLPSMVDLPSFQHDSSMRLWQQCRARRIFSLIQ
jgi:hypothetical protein